LYRNFVYGKKFAIIIIRFVNVEDIVIGDIGDIGDLAPTRASAWRDNPIFTTPYSRKMERKFAHDARREDGVANKRYLKMERNSNPLPIIVLSLRITNKLTDKGIANENGKEDCTGLVN
jgi:hypothetical protein